MHIWFVLQVSIINSDGTNCFWTKTNEIAEFSIFDGKKTVLDKMWTKIRNLDKIGGFGRTKKCVRKRPSRLAA